MNLILSVDSSIGSTITPYVVSLHPSSHDLLYLMHSLLRNLLCLNLDETNLEREVMYLAQQQQKKKMLSLNLRALQANVISIKKQSKKTRDSVILLSQQLLQQSLLTAEVGIRGPIPRPRCRGLGLKSSADGAIAHLEGTPNTADYCGSGSGRYVRDTYTTNTKIKAFKGDKTDLDWKDFLSISARSNSSLENQKDLPRIAKDANSESVWCTKHFDRTKKAKIFSKHIKKYLPISSKVK